MASEVSDGSVSQAATAAALAKLCADVDDDVEVMRRFVSDYLRLLAGRVDLLRQRLGARDFEAACVSLLSLETTSAMIGASAVVESARALRLAVREHRYHETDALLKALLVSASDLRSRLSDEERGDLGLVG